MTPGMTSRRNSRQSTFRCRVWLTPEAAVVKVSTAWTLADAIAGDTPMTLTSNVLLISPKAIPSAPSTTCAAKPTAMKGSRPTMSIDEKSGMQGISQVE